MSRYRFVAAQRNHYPVRVALPAGEGADQWLLRVATGAAADNGAVSTGLGSGTGQGLRGLRTLL